MKTVMQTLCFVVSAGIIMELMKMMTFLRIGWRISDVIYEQLVSYITVLYGRPNHPHFTLYFGQR